MSSITLEKVKLLIQDSGYRDSFKKRLLITEEISAYLEYEIIPVFDDKGNGFALIKDTSEGGFNVIRFEASKLKANIITGRQRAVICDLCYTWRRGSGISRVTFYSQRKNGISIGYLCCSKLDCSKHVRSLTEDARFSRAQLKEDLTDINRIKRLEQRCNKLFQDIIHA